MYFVLYDKQIKSIGGTYLLEKWSRVRRAVDFDDLKVIGEQIPYSAVPFFVVVNDNQGRPMFSGLASTPDIDQNTKKTTIILKDYATLFNSETVFDWSRFTGTTLSEYLDYVLTTWKTDSPSGFDSIVWDLSGVGDILLDDSISFGTEKENCVVKDLIFDALLFYDLYYDVELNVYEKNLTFRFKKASVNRFSVRLKDFDINTIEKSFGEYNRARVYTQDFSLHQTWALTEDNSVVMLPSDKNFVFPAKWKNFIAQEADTETDKMNALNSAIYDAVMGLAENRYQESVELNVRQHKSMIDLSTIDFSSAVDVYTDEGFYRTLPVGEIETSSDGVHLVRLGHRIQELTQEI